MLCSSLMQCHVINVCSTYIERYLHIRILLHHELNNQISSLFLSSNHLIALPDTPLGLKQLKKLDICHNQIDCIPENFLHTCSKLEHLEASFNYISEYSLRCFTILLTGNDQEIMTRLGSKLSSQLQRQAKILITLM